MAVLTVATARSGVVSTGGEKDDRGELGFAKLGKNDEQERGGLQTSIYRALAFVVGGPGQQRRSGRGSPHRAGVLPRVVDGEDEDDDFGFDLIQAKRYVGWAGPSSWAAPGLVRTAWTSCCWAAQWPGNSFFLFPFYLFYVFYYYFEFCF
jgi:hypothetical protein